MAGSFWSSLKEKVLAPTPKLGGMPKAGMAAKKPAQPLKLDAERLTTILQRHKQWLKSGGKQGARAMLRNAIISRERGRIANFDLSQADLRGAMLRGIVLEKVDLTGALLRDADLRGAKFASTRGVTEEQLAGADLMGAELPAAGMRFGILEQVPEIARKARTILIVLVSTCLYALLTVAVTTDAGLFLNGPSTPLPLLFVKIPIPFFYWIVPPVIFGLFVTLQIYLVRLWGQLGRLPAVFPDGATMDQYLPSWLFHGVPFAHFPRLGERRPRLFGLQFGMAIFLAWGVAPLTLLALWFRYLVRHDGLGGTLHVVLLTAMLALGLYAFALMGATLRGDLVHESGYVPHRTEFLKQFGPLSIVLTVLVLVGLSLYSAKAMGGFGLTPFHVPDLSYVNLPGANLRGNDLSGAEMSRAQLTGADLRGADLRGANLNESVLSRALLSGAILDDASLLATQLDGADLRGASLQRTHLDGGNLKGATLTEANLKRALVRKADVRKAALDTAQLGGSDWTGSDLSGANLSFSQGEESRFTGANLTRADMRTINLTAADLKGAGLSGANLENATLMQVNGEKVDLGQANLKGADLKFSVLKGADLRSADMAKADVRGADLQGVVLSKADLSGANLTETNLDCVKLSFASSDKETRLPGHCQGNKTR